MHGKTGLTHFKCKGINICNYTCTLIPPLPVVTGIKIESCMAHGNLELTSSHASKWISVKPCKPNISSIIYLSEFWMKRRQVVSFFHIYICMVCNYWRAPNLILSFLKLLLWVDCLFLITWMIWKFFYCEWSTPSPFWFLLSSLHLY